MESLFQELVIALTKTCCDLGLPSRDVARRPTTILCRVTFWIRFETQ